MSRHPDRRDGLVALIGASALVFSLLYFLSDVMELLHGGFSTPQLALTYAAEAPLPLFVIGLYAVQRPQIGTGGLIAALTYAYSFVFFTGTVLYALVDRTPSWDALATRLGAWVTIHSVLMVLAGVGFGVSTIRAGVLPAWTGATLIAGMILMTVSAAMPDGAQTVAAGVRDLAFAGMGASLLRRSGGIDPPRRVQVSEPRIVASQTEGTFGPCRTRSWVSTPEQ